ncbi:cell division protein FtsA [Bacillus tianshenii]|uniref:cell division protein FtsA n=1 Tax=Sutcliffiella tianshenii TaxID=1463404 RepID=UPI001CD7DA46|nr:cell division protein FtsA [Bacillus tianshenii]MCA1319907.1 cell division protein FtsA [Bacillus tianshenii]
MNGNSKVFALDIGTRSVVGLLLEQQNEQFKVLDMVTKEHEERAMLDGQIHDILAVSKVIEHVKLELEKKHGPLTKVCVAAAGRALKTQTAHSTQDIKGKSLLTENDIFLLELAAVQDAQAQLLKNEQDSANQYFCVGYSILRYYLDGQEIGSLLDQRGEIATAEVIATFLPKIVVESLISALQRANLQLEALTLEPIAAINVLIPPSMRRLNVALVDIGAGTSDVAITRDGTVTAYGMVPVAGDEITEGLSDHYLLDFPQAEKAKREMIHKDQITFTDILGFEHTLMKESMIEQIRPYIEKLAKAITDEIKHQNNRQSPRAVMLVGGGSLTPTLTSAIAQYLDLPENRVAIRGVDAISQLQQSDISINGPEFVTPIGIAIAAKQKPIEYVSVTVNELQVRLFDVKKLTIGDSLLAAGISINKLVGKPGLALMVTVNGKHITLPGSLGSAPEIYKNGKPAQSYDSIQNGDTIEVKQGVDGVSASATVRDVIGKDLPSIKLEVNGTTRVIDPTLLINEKKASLDDYLNDRDKIVFNYPSIIKELLTEEEDFTPFVLYLNDEKTQFEHFSKKLYVNGKKASLQDGFSPGDVIEWKEGSEATVKMLSVIQNYETKQEISVQYNGQKIVLHKTLLEFYRNGVLLTEEETLANGDHIQLMVRRKEPFIFQDIFRFVEIEKPLGAGSFKLQKNGEESSFYDYIQQGDELDIKWEKKVYQ